MPAGTQDFIESFVWESRTAVSHRPLIINPDTKIFSFYFLSRTCLHDSYAVQVCRWCSVTASPSSFTDDVCALRLCNRGHEQVLDRASRIITFLRLFQAEIFRYGAADWAYERKSRQQLWYTHITSILRPQNRFNALILLARAVLLQHRSCIRRKRLQRISSVFDGKISRRPSLPGRIFLERFHELLYM
jgi:hypothetical protein